MKCLAFAVIINLLVSFKSDPTLFFRRTKKKKVSHRTGQLFVLELWEMLHCKGSEVETDRLHISQQPEKDAELIILK